MLVRVGILAARYYYPDRSDGTEMCFTRDNEKGFGGRDCKKHPRWNLMVFSVLQHPECVDAAFTLQTRYRKMPSTKEQQIQRYLAGGGLYPKATLEKMILPEVAFNTYVLSRWDMRCQGTALKRLRLAQAWEGQASAPATNAAACSCCRQSRPPPRRGGRPALAGLLTSTRMHHLLLPCTCQAQICAHHRQQWICRPHEESPC